MKKEDNIVYSYTLGEKPKSYGESSVDPKYKSPDDGFVRLQIERNSRGGKTVSIIYNFPENSDLHTICTDIKRKAGSGGTIKENRIEIQGDKRDIIEKYLTEKGFKVKRVGG